MRLILVGSILLSTAVQSHAVTLGRHGGAAVIGRPLDIRVEALAGPNEDLSAACVRTDVYFGDSQVPSGSVRFSPQRSAPDAKASIRVQTTVPVNEPVVSVVVKVGCDAPFSKRYVLLADPVIEQNTSLATPGLGTARDLGAVVAPTRLPPAGAQRSGDVGRANAGQTTERADGGNAINEPAETVVSAPKTLRKTAVRNSEAASKPTVARSVVRKPAAQPVAEGPKLHLEPLDVNLGVEREPVLKLSLSMLSEPTTSEQERAAAGQLWKAINASPEDVLRDAQKLAVLEAESKGLREQEATDKSAIKALQEQVNQSRYMTWLAYLLGALLLLALLSLWLFRRRKEVVVEGKKPGAWWNGAQNTAAVAGTAGVAKAVATRRDPAGGVDIDLDLGLDGESGFEGYESLHDSSMSALLLPSVSAKLNEDQQAVGSRSVATEELFDVQQQSEFFLSLGEPEKAIGVLKNHLADSQEPSPLAYLDLFKLYHLQGKPREYEILREEFNLKFNAGAPEFDQYSDDSNGLEGYETAFGRIQALWPQPRVLDVIESSIFRDANDGLGEVFDLEAYRELLLLHAMAKSMIHQDRPIDRPSDFENTAIKPLKAVAGATILAGAAAVKGNTTVPATYGEPSALSRIGLDVDLDAMSDISAFEASLPEVDVMFEPSAAIKDRVATGIEDEGNLIDFEVMDFMPPGDDEAAPDKVNDR